MPEIATGKGEAHDPKVSTDASTPIPFADRMEDRTLTIERLRAKVAKQEEQLADAKAALAEAEGS